MTTDPDATRPVPADLRHSQERTIGQLVSQVTDDLRRRPDRVAVRHFPGDQPGHGLQAGMRVRRDVHGVAVIGPDRAGTVEVDEAPGADHPPLPVRQQPQHFAARADLGVDGVVDRRLAAVTLRVVRAAGVQVRHGVAHTAY